MGAIFLTTPNLPREIIGFFMDISFVPGGRFIFPAPRSTHPELYSALQRFCYGLAIVSAVVLALRLYVGSPPGKKAESVSGIILWLGTGFLAGMLLSEAIGWFAFVGGFFVFLGISIIARVPVIAVLRA